MRLRLTPLAALDVAEARDWYSEQDHQLGDRFEQALDGTFANILQHPRAFPIVRRKTRRAMMIDPFSAFQVFYRAESTDLVVVGVIHGSRHPKHWKRRT